MTLDSAPKARPQERVDLSQTPPFHLGPLEVRPATREVTGPGVRVAAEPRALQVLTTLAQAQGATVSRDRLVQCCWEGRAIGEDAIQRAVAKARRLAELTDPPAFAIESIARVGYRLLAETREQAPATPPAAPARSSDGAAASRRGLVAGGVVLAGAAAIGGGALLWPRPAVVEPPRIAVLPFDNLSPDPQLGYFADGLAEDILNALAQAGGLRVTGRSSSFHFRGRDKAAAAAALGARYILDGSVLREGTQLRVSASLADARSKETLWSDVFDRAIAQGLQVEDEIAGEVARALKVRLTARAPRRVDLEVFELYLKAREAMRSQDPATLKGARLTLQDVTRRAPDFAAPFIQLAISCYRDDYLYTPAECVQWDAVGRTAARRAMALDPASGAAVALASQIVPLANHWTEIDDGQRRGLDLSPNDPELLLWRSWMLLNMGRLSAALEAVQRARLQDPLEYWTNTFTVWILTGLGRFQEAEAALAAFPSSWSDQEGVATTRFWLQLGSGRLAEAAATAQAWLQAHPQPVATGLSFFAAQARAAAVGTPGEKRRTADALLASARKGAGAASAASQLLPLLGFPDEAVEVVRSLYLRRGAYVLSPASPDPPLRGAEHPFILFQPAVAPLRRAGRLREVFDGIGLSAFWRARGRPDPTLEIA